MFIDCKKNEIPTLSNLKAVNIKIKGTDDSINIVVKNNTTMFTIGDYQLTVVSTIGKAKKCDKPHVNEVHPIWKDAFFIITVLMISAILIMYYFFDVTILIT